MIRVLFLLIPVFFSGLCLLLGETFNWLKKEGQKENFTTTKVWSKAGRK